MAFSFSLGEHLLGCEDCIALNEIGMTLSGGSKSLPANLDNISAICILDPGR